jgi:hypothetical protein
MLCYAGNGRFGGNLSAATLARYRTCFRSQKTAFAKGYRRKVKAAWKEATRMCGVTEAEANKATKKTAEGHGRKKRKRRDLP